MDTSSIDEAPVKRGRGRPPGSRNRPAPAPPSAEEIVALRQSYAAAITARALANDRAHRLRDLIRMKLGRQGLVDVEEAILAGQPSA